jgi:hypothetical protein
LLHISGGDKVLENDGVGLIVTLTVAGSETQPWELVTLNV